MALDGRRRRAASVDAMTAMIDVAVEAALDNAVEDPATRAELALSGWHETDVMLAVMVARRVRELLSS